MKILGIVGNSFVVIRHQPALKHTQMHAQWQRKLLLLFIQTKSFTEQPDFRCYLKLLGRSEKSSCIPPLLVYF